MTGLPRILGIGRATPAHACSSVQAAALAIELGGLEGDAARFAQAIHARSGIERRGSCLIHAPAREGDRVHQSFFRRERGSTRGPGTEARMGQFALHAADLALRACRSALLESCVDPASITHLLVVSCTGLAAPGVDVDLIEGLGLNAGVHRVGVGFMGCHGAIVGMRTAASIAHDPAARVLVVCVELCSLHMQFSDRPDHIVANALFADGAAACVVGATGAPPDRASRHEPALAPAQRACPRIIGAASRLLPGTRDAMRWDVTDHGFAMTLAESVPGAIRGHVRGWLEPWLASLGLDAERARQAGWIVHPGGPKVLDACAEALDLPSGALDRSRAVLREHGNMSSATVLFILEQALSAGVRGPMILLGFGPGLTCEAMLCEA